MHILHSCFHFFVGKDNTKKQNGVQATIVFFVNTAFYFVNYAGSALILTD